MRQRKSQTRCCYRRMNPPTVQALAEFESFAADTRILYDHTSPQGGEYGAVFERIREGLEQVGRDGCGCFSVCAVTAFREVLLDYVPADPSRHIQLLGQLGDFTHQDTKEAFERWLGSVHVDRGNPCLRREEESILATCWHPHPGSLLDYLFNDPAEVGRLLAERLRPGNGHSLRLIGHSLTGVPAAALRPFVDSLTVAYVRGADIHLLAPVLPVLEEWEADAVFIEGCAPVSLLGALLIHELTEMVLEESKIWDFLEAHIIACTLERCLKGHMLHVAVEDFFLHQPSAPRATQSPEVGMSMLGVDEEPEEIYSIPEEDDEELEQLPLDSGCEEGVGNILYFFPAREKER